MRSEAKKQTEDTILSAKRTCLEGKLASLHEGLTVPARTKKTERVPERVDRLRERYATGPFSRDFRAVSRPFRTRPKRIGLEISSVSDSSSMSHSSDARSVGGGRWRRREVLDWRYRKML